MPVLALYYAFKPLYGSEKPQTDRNLPGAEADPEEEEAGDEEKNVAIDGGEGESQNRNNEQKHA